jgi:hypothetical protein
MKKLFSQLMVVTVTTGFVLIARGADDLDQSEFPQITAQPIDQAVFVGSNAVLTVQATNVDGYQWLCNGVAIDGQTNSSLTLQNVSTDDVALYSCNVSKGTQVVPTRAASLNVLTVSPSDTITVYGTPLASGGSQGTCPGPYAGYVTYTKTVSQGWGWAPSSSPPHTASDGGGRTDTKVQYGGSYGDSGCNQTTVTLPNSPPSPKYRFAIYFPNNVPSGSYPIILTGFNP